MYRVITTLFSVRFTSESMNLKQAQEFIKIHKTSYLEFYVHGEWYMCDHHGHVVGEYSDNISSLF